MSETELYEHLVLVIEAFKINPRTENQTELFVENMANTLDEKFLKGDLTQEQYDNLYLELPK